MNFKAYDILASLIPGFLFILALILLFDLTYDKDMVIGYTAIAFLFGYILNTIGSWLENFYFFTWHGKPSNNLIDGKGTLKIKIYHSTEIKQNLLSKTLNQNPTNDELFSIAMRNVMAQKDTRIEDFNAMYAFSRTLLTTVLIAGIFLIIKNYDDWRFYIIIIPTILVLWYRCKERGYYFAKEVLNVYSKLNNL